MREISLPLPWSTVGKVSARLQALSRGLWRLIKEKPLGAFGGVIVLGLLLCALLAPLIATYPYDQTNVRNRLKPLVPSSTLAPITWDATSSVGSSMAPVSR